MAGFGTFVDNVMLSAAEMNSLSVYRSYTPKCFQSVEITPGAADTSGRYVQINKIVHGIFQFSVGSNGTANNRIEITLPVTASSASMGVIGCCWFLPSTSFTGSLRLLCITYSTTRMAFLTNDSIADTTYFGQTNGPTRTLTGSGSSGDLLRGFFMYEAA